MKFAGLPFEDRRISRDTFVEMKKSGELSFGQVPALVVSDGTSTQTLVQTAAVARYIGKACRAQQQPLSRGPI